MRVLAVVVAIFSVLHPEQCRAQAITRIGILADFSSVTLDSLSTAASMALKEVPDRDQRFKVEVISADHQMKPDVAVGIARRWIDTEKVSAIIVSGGSAVSLAVAGLTGERKVLSIMLDVALPPKERKAPTFNWASNDRLIGLTLANYLVDDGHKNFSIVAPDTAFGNAIAKATSKVVTGLGGNIIEVSNYSWQGSWSGLKASARDATIVMFGSFLNGIVDQIDDKQMPFRLAFGSPLLLADIDKIGRTRVENAIFATSFYWDVNEATRDWTKRFLNARRERSTSPPDVTEAGIYSAVRHYLRALLEARESDADKVAEKMKQLPVDDFFAPNGRVRANGQLVHPVYIVQIKPEGDIRYAGDFLKVLEVIPGIAAQEAACGTPCPKKGACPQSSDQPDCPCPKGNACPQ
ncbi:ABC transporter substrate-binding protein [Bradyrhizobium sp. NC92]|uniref:ABC transporter substrate-binding protein n=1 Tax=Bradyrhizobium sp. (strain NC92) TaxID=55395 RepID=UPI0021AA930A|nr:ABC transporter substrate-binding protein [Bradyrhizobium sp. NC92]UWU68186.1 ABC transporter substrate-binding protein [Bradyrhizobium sp. NC92]